MGYPQQQDCHGDDPQQPFVLLLLPLSELQNPGKPSAIAGDDDEHERNICCGGGYAIPARACIGPALPLGGCVFDLLLAGRGLVRPAGVAYHTQHLLIVYASPALV